VHTSEEALQWGIKGEWRGETWLWFADPGRTVLDVLDDPSLAGGIRHAAEITSAYLDEYPPEILIDYAGRSGNHTVFKRLGYVIESLGLDQPLLVNASQDRLSAGISALDPGGPQGGRRNMRWRLRVNATIAPQAPS
jgi:predicted transcriptional regulator of viral defense system